MKNKSNLFIFIVLFLTQSCNRHEVNTIDNNNFNRAENLKNTRVTEKLVDFRNDPILKEIMKNEKGYIVSLQIKNYTKIKFHLDKIVENSKKLKTKYGEKEMYSYLDTLASIEQDPYIDNPNDETFIDSLNIYNEILGEHDGNKCTLNINGTTYWGQCNTWERVKAYISAALNCSQPEPNTPSSEWKKYYECVQGAICQNC